MLLVIVDPVWYVNLIDGVRQHQELEYFDINVIHTAIRQYIVDKRLFPQSPLIEDTLEKTLYDYIESSDYIANCIFSLHRQLTHVIPNNLKFSDVELVFNANDILTHMIFVK